MDSTEVVIVENTTSENTSFSSQVFLTTGLDADTLTDNLNADLTQFLSYKISNLFDVIYMPLVSISGIVGNVLTLAVMLQKRNRTLSPCVFFIGLAVTDILVLMLAMSAWALLVLRLGNLAASKSAVWNCKIFNYLQQMGLLSGIIITVAITAERLVAVKKPLKARILFTARRAWITLGMIWLSVAIFTLPHMYAVDIILEMGVMICATFVHTNGFIEIYSLANVLLSSVVPFVSLLIMNTAIIYTLRSNNKVGSSLKNIPSVAVTCSGNLAIDKRSDHSARLSSIGPSCSMNHKSDVNDDLKYIARNHQAKQRLVRENEATRMLLLICLANVVLTLPKWLCLLSYNYIDKYASSKDFADYVSAIRITTRLSMTNSAVNFLLYCQTGAKFREDVRSLFRCKKKY